MPRQAKLPAGSPRHSFLFPSARWEHLQSQVYISNNKWLQTIIKTPTIAMTVTKYFLCGRTSPDLVLLCCKTINQVIPRHQDSRRHSISPESEWLAIIKKTNNNRCWGRCGRRGGTLSADRNVNHSSAYGNQYGGSSKNQTWDYCTSILVCVFKGTEASTSQKCLPVCICCHTIHNGQSGSGSSLAVHQQMSRKRVWFVYRVGFYTTEIMTFAGKWTKVGNR